MQLSGTYQRLLNDGELVTAEVLNAVARGIGFTVPALTPLDLPAGQYWQASATGPVTGVYSLTQIPYPGLTVNGVLTMFKLPGAMPANAQINLNGQGASLGTAFADASFLSGDIYPAAGSLPQNAWALVSNDVNYGAGFQIYSGRQWLPWDFASQGVAYTAAVTIVGSVIELTFEPPITQRVDGMEIMFKPPSAYINGYTINVNGLGNDPVYNDNKSGALVGSSTNAYAQYSIVTACWNANAGGVGSGGWQLYVT